MVNPRDGRWLRKPPGVVLASSVLIGLAGTATATLSAQLRLASSDPAEVSVPWVLDPLSRSAPPKGLDQQALQAALEESFQEPDPQ